MFMTQTASPDKEDSVWQVPPFLLLWKICPSCYELILEVPPLLLLWMNYPSIPHLSGFLTPCPCLLLFLTSMCLNYSLEGLKESLFIIGVDSKVISQTCSLTALTIFLKYNFGSLLYFLCSVPPKDPKSFAIKNLVAL